MIFFLNTQEQVVGHASNDAPKALPYKGDKLSEDLDTGAQTFEFLVPANHAESGRIREEGYIVTQGYEGELLQFQIASVEDVHDSDGLQKRIYCEFAWSELNGHIVRPYDLPSADAKTAAAFALSGTRWQVGKIDFAGVQDLSSDNYDTALKMLQDIKEAFGGDIRFYVTMKGNKITGRFVDLVQQVGANRGKTITFDKNIQSAKRIFDRTTVATALIGIGRGDSNSNRLTFTNTVWTEGVNGAPVTKPAGQDWVGDPDALKLWGVDGRHITKVFEYDTTNPTVLLKKTWEELQRIKSGVYQYEVEAAFLDALGWDWERSAVGDTVQIMDHLFEPPLMLSARIVQLERSKMDPTANKMVLGDYLPRISRAQDMMEIQSTLMKNYEKWGSEGMTIVRQATEPPGDANTIWIRPFTKFDLAYTWDTATNKWVPSGPLTAADIDAQDQIFKQNTAPPHLLGRLWLDTTTTPNILKRSTGSAWVNASPTTAAHVGAEAALYKQASAPAHSLNRLWLETDVTPNVLWRSTGTAWVKVTPTLAAEVQADAAGAAAAAQSAAEAVARAEAAAAQTRAEATADGYVTAEENARITQAALNLKAAQDDAQIKANAARDAAIIAAGIDAGQKASAAQTAAENLARAEATAAQTRAETYADGKVTAEETARMNQAAANLAAAKADAEAKAAAAQAAAQTHADAVAAAEAAAIQVGGRNYHKSMLKGYQAGNTFITHVDEATIDVTYRNVASSPYVFFQETAPLVIGDEYTLSFYATFTAADTDLSALTLRYGLRNGGFSDRTQSLTLGERVRIVHTFKPTASTGLKLIVFNSQQTNVPRVLIEKVTISKGNKPMDWTPAPEDVTADAAAKAEAAQAAAIAAAASDAAAKASAAQSAAEAVARAEAAAAQARAEATADGWISAEESERISQANANLATAQADASAKASAAQTAAENLARAEAAAAKSGAIEASDPAGSANAAKEAANQYTEDYAEANIIKQPDPPAHLNGRLWLETDVTPNVLWRSTGTAWVKSTATLPTDIGAEGIVYKQNTAPAAVLNRMWLDTSYNPPRLRYWNGTEWKFSTPTDASQIGGVTDESARNHAKVAEYRAYLAAAYDQTQQVLKLADPIRLAPVGQYTDTIKNAVISAYNNLSSYYTTLSNSINGVISDGIVTATEESAVSSNKATFELRYEALAEAIAKATQDAQGLTVGKINITDTATIGNALYLGSQASYEFKYIYFNNSNKIYSDGSDTFIYSDGDINISSYGVDLNSDGGSFYMQGSFLSVEFNAVNFSAAPTFNSGLTAYGTVNFYSASGTNRLYWDGTRLLTNVPETGFCGIGAMNALGITGVLTGVGVNFRTRKTYVPSSISIAGTSSVLQSSTNIQTTNITADGFWLYINDTGTAKTLRYWRGNYTA